MMLAKIIEEKEKQIADAKKAFSRQEIIDKCASLSNSRHDFKHAVSKHGDINLIAEIKKASPSRGVIREDFNPQEIAKIYQFAGASAISVLTEEKYFLGSLDYINKIKQVCTLPILRKDFIIDEYQIYESRYFGADAILLIADILSIDEIRQFMEIAAALAIDCLLEVHNEEDLSKAINSGAGIIGINNRDLHTFKLSLKTSENIIPLIPKDRVIVVESGIKSNADAMYFKSLGANAVLIGEAFMDEADIAKKVKEVLGK
ncbi:MAG: indole-3-glycerol phosphate synthase TrpC [Candidatus Omnitrophica bacterium]|nr:indole-3-glycerol phosphate synthase TrpC [Candidatus Omnitrophota bacterium]